MYVFLSVVLYFSSLLFLYVVSYFLIDLFSSLVLFVRYALHSFGRDVVRSFVISFVRYVCSFISCLFRFFYNVDRRSCSSSVIYLCRSSFRYFVLYVCVSLFRLFIYVSVYVVSSFCWYIFLYVCTLLVLSFVIYVLRYFCSSLSLSIYIYIYIYICSSFFLSVVHYLFRSFFQYVCMCLFRS